MPRSTEEVRRFDGVERAAHWLTALVVLTLVATGVILYVPALSLAVGQRLVIEDLHLYAGIAVFVPLAAALCGPWGRRLRADLKSMGRFTAAESAWLRSIGKRGRVAVGKFNPGQKLNTIAIGSMLTVLLATGIILRWFNFVSVYWRTGATFVHDWFALAVIVLVVGHILFALAHPVALRSMIVGTVPRSWTARHAPSWQAGAGPDATADAAALPPVAGPEPRTLNASLVGPELDAGAVVEAAGVSRRGVDAVAGRREVAQHGEGAPHSVPPVASSS